MGHLSTSDRVCTAVPNGTTTTMDTTLLKRANGAANGSIKSERNVPNGVSSSATAEFPPAANGKTLQAAPVDDDNPQKKFKYQHKNNINLEEYGRNFKGDKVFGIQFKAPLKWGKIIQISLLHLVCAVAFVTYPIRKLTLATTVWAFFCGGVGGFGVTAGAHRYWTHKSYKANLPLRIILMACFTLSGQNTLYDWVRDHRVHHKYSETDADPHNANRGFFFAHVGWLMMLKHPEVLRRGRQIDMSDVMGDPVVQFHQKWFIPLKTILCFILPTVIPVYFWGEEWHLALATQCLFRYVSGLNFTWLVNSAAHIYGNRPYDKRIMPSENVYVSILAMGEGWHNYHHVFPWDYKAAELGKYTVNFSTMLVDAFSKIGWAWDLKEPSKELVRRTLEKYGDGTHESMIGLSNTPQSAHDHCHPPEVPDPELELEDDAESSSTESSKLDENDNDLKKKKSLR